MAGSLARRGRALLASALVFAAASPATSAPNALARVPPRGWMSWQSYRCETDCATFPDICISERLYRAQADALVASGLAAAGFATVHLDDCIVDIAGRDPITHALRADPIRFPSGFKALGDYLHARNLSFGFYTAVSTTTCGGYPGSRGFEAVDAASFAEWGVDYLKADGCGDPDYYKVGYPALGAALQATGRDIIYSCSWPAYLGDDEAQKPFAAFIAAGCNSWRNYLDMGPTIGYLDGILEHFGNYSDVLSLWAGPGHWHDADMLLAGVDGVPAAAQAAQLAVYAVLALPLILGNDMRALPPAAAALLTNADALAISADAAGRAGVRLGGATAAGAPLQTWVRPLANGDVAVVLQNVGAASAHPWHSACAPFNATVGGYFAPAAAQPASWCGPALGQSLMDWYCCNSEDCAGYNFSTATRSGCLFKDTAGGFVPADANTTGYTKPGFAPPRGAPADMTVSFADVGLFPGSTISVYDVWARRVVATTNASSFTAAAVPWRGAAFLRLSTVAQ